METTTNFERLVDSTDFGAVRRYLRTAKSPVASVLFAASKELLAEVATILDAGNERSPGSRQRQLSWLLEAGQISVGADQRAEQNGVGVDMEAIPDDTRCHVIYFPSVYLVHVPGLALDRWSRRHRHPEF